MEPSRTRLPHTGWQLLEHSRLAQWDILEFSRNPKHVSPPFPGGYWPKTPAPPNDEAWDESVAAFQRDLQEMVHLVANPRIGSVRQNTSWPGANDFAGSACCSRITMPITWASLWICAALSARGLRRSAANKRASCKYPELAVGCCTRVVGGEFESEAEAAMIRVENMSKIEAEAGNSRRDFLKGILGAGAFVLGVSMMPEQLFAESARRRRRRSISAVGESPAAAQRLFGDWHGRHGLRHRAPFGDGKRCSHVLAANCCR